MLNDEIVHDLMFRFLSVSIFIAPILFINIKNQNSAITKNTVYCMIKEIGKAKQFYYFLFLFPHRYFRYGHKATVTKPETRQVK